VRTCDPCRVFIPLPRAISKQERLFNYPVGNVTCASSNMCPSEWEECVRVCDGARRKLIVNSFAIVV
jgi:hypothetical protein